MTHPPVPQRSLPRPWHTLTHRDLTPVQESAPLVSDTRARGCLRMKRLSRALLRSRGAPRPDSQPDASGAETESVNALRHCWRLAPGWLIWLAMTYRRKTLPEGMPLNHLVSVAVRMGASP